MRVVVCLSTHCSAKLDRFFAEDLRQSADFLFRDIGHLSDLCHVVFGNALAEQIPSTSDLFAFDCEGAGHYRVSHFGFSAMLAVLAHNDGGVVHYRLLRHGVDAHVNRRDTEFARA